MLDHLSKVILLLGAPGAGKTATCWGNPVEPSKIGGGFESFTGYIYNIIYIYMYPLVFTYTKVLNMAIEIVDFPMKNGGSFHSYVSLPEGIYIYSSCII